MIDLLRLLAQNALLLVAGTTLLLALGCGAAALSRSPVHRQRIAELTIAGVLAWLMLALFPLPRMLPDYLSVAPHQEADALRSPSLTAPNVLDAARPVQTAPPAEPVALLPDAALVVLTEPDGTRPASTALTDEDIAATPSLAASPSESMLLPPQPLASPPPSASWHIDRSQIAGLGTGAYLAGGALALLWILVGHLLLFRLRNNSEKPPAWLAQQFRALARESQVTPPQLIVSSLCSRPISWGTFWPIVVLPQSLCRPENKSQVRTILLHELGHIARHDARGSLLFTAALPLLYCHPLYWWLRREGQLAAELVADDWAAAQTGKETYVEELVALARCTGRGDLPLFGVTGLFTSPSMFYRRMHMLLAREKPLSTKTSLAWRLASASALAAAVTLATAVAGVRPAAGQAEPVAPAVAAPPAAQDPGAVPSATPAAPGAENPLAPVPVPPAVKPDPQRPDNPLVIKSSQGSADEQKLAAEEAALEAEVKELQARLKALEARRASKRGEHTIKGWNVEPGKRTITLMRSDDKGGFWTEVWSTDEKGQPDRIIAKSVPAPQKTAATADGKIVVKENVEPDGGRTLIILDAATGKVIETRRFDAKDPRITPPSVDPVPADPKRPQPPAVTRYPTPILSAPAATPPSPVAPPAISFPSATVKGPQLAYTQLAADPNRAAGSQQLDLVSLATSYADAASAVEAAQAKVAEIEPLAKQTPSAISQHDISAAKLALSAAQRKEQLLRRIAEVALASAHQDFERTSELHKKGVTTGGASDEARTRMEILKQILSTAPEGKKSDGDGKKL